MVFHSQRSSQLIHTDNMRWRLALKNTETWEFQCCETRKFQIELTQIFIFLKWRVASLIAEFDMNMATPGGKFCP